MNKLRKLMERLWVNKERIMFAIMVLVLGWYVYMALNPPPLPEMPIHVRPESPPADIEEVKIPEPPMPRALGQWSDIYGRNPLWYHSVKGGDDDDAERDRNVGVKLLKIRAVGDGHRVQLETANRVKKWYSEGESFEEFEVLSIDVEGQTCEIYSERLGKRVTLRLP